MQNNVAMQNTYMKYILTILDIILKNGRNIFWFYDSFIIFFVKKKSSLLFSHPNYHQLFAPHQVYDSFTYLRLQECSLSVIVSALGPGNSGFITAQARENPNDSNGFVFKNCNVLGNGNTYLGRAWRGYARVLFYNTSMANIIQPSGWDQWKYHGQE